MNIILNIDRNAQIQQPVTADLVLANTPARLKRNTLTLEAV